MPWNLVLTAPILNTELVKLRCGGRHCSLLVDADGHRTYGPDQLSKLTSRYGQVLKSIDANKHWLDEDLWFELDDVRVLSVAFDTPYMMVLNRNTYPIVLYDGAEICAFRSPENYEKPLGRQRKRPGIEITKGFGYSPGHFNALVTRPVLPAENAPVFANGPHETKKNTKGKRKRHTR